MSVDGQGRPTDTVGVTTQPLSPAEAAAVARFETFEPAPESWCDHDWMERGGPGDEWRECFLCGLEEDA